MTQTIEQKLEAAKQMAQEAERKRIQLETKLEAAQTKKAELLKKCESLNIKPEELEQEIATLQEVINNEMKYLDEILPKETNNTDDLPY